MIDRGLKTLLKKGTTFLYLLVSLPYDAAKFLVALYAYGTKKTVVWLYAHPKILTTVHAAFARFPYLRGAIARYLSGIRKKSNKTVPSTLSDCFVRIRLFTFLGHYLAVKLAFFNVDLSRPSKPWELCLGDPVAKVAQDIRSVLGKFEDK